jgi:dTDP-4-amino-4,6-dideoxygalactose transaminase
VAGLGESEILLGRPFLPPFEDMVDQLRELWETRQLTNNGQNVRRLRSELCDHLDVRHLSLVANGTLGLLLTLRALGITGEVITTPFTFAATTHALLWSGLTPVFVDIDPNTLNINPDRIEASITPETSAILAVHCFGRPCATEALERLARSHGLKLIYDAAHAFGVTEGGRSVLLRGDASVLSFHATKVFHTLEGGAVVSPNPAIRQAIDRLRNFGFDDEADNGCVVDGINAKLNEMNALVGLLSLPYRERLHAERARIAHLYRQGLQAVEWLRCQPSLEGENYSYFPIIVNQHVSLDVALIQDQLSRKGIGSRRYFHPLVTNLPPYCTLPSAQAANLPNAHSVAERILCLPIHNGMGEADVQRVLDSLAAIDPGEQVALAEVS